MATLASVLEVHCKGFRGGSGRLGGDHHSDVVRGGRGLNQEASSSVGAQMGCQKQETLQAS